MSKTGIIQPTHNKVKGIAIGIASSGRYCPVEWGIALATQVYPVNTNLAWINVVGKDVDAARNTVVDEALKKKIKYIWFIDDDTVPPIDAASKLMYLLDNNGPEVGGKVMVAGGVYCVKQNPPSPLVLMGPGKGPYWKWKIGDTFKCWGLGTGCMMINVEVFKYLKKPYFKTTSEEGFSETDDLYFCQKVHDAGFDVMAHGGILCRHWDMQNSLIYTLPSGSYPMTPRKAKRKKRNGK